VNAVVVAVHLLLWALVAVAIGYAILCSTLTLAQRSLIYFPQKGFDGDPDSLLLLARPDAQVAISVRPMKGARALVYFGGNAEDVAQNLEGLAATFPTSALYLMHYRGYGRSSGRPTERALQADALALFDHVRSEHAEVVVLGRSLGSGLAVFLASQRPCSRVILVTPYDSLLALAARRYPYIPVRWLLWDRFESWRYASKITVPTFLIEAEHDDIIPRESSRRLLGRFQSGIADSVVVEGAGHNSILDHPDYLAALLTQDHAVEWGINR